MKELYSFRCIRRDSFVFLLFKIAARKEQFATLLWVNDK